MAIPSAPRKQANYEIQKQALFTAMTNVWDEANRQPAIRLLAMVSIGAMWLVARLGARNGEHFWIWYVP